MQEVKIFDLIATSQFDKQSFFHLVDSEGRLDDETKQHYWDEYVIYSKQNLISFYNSLNQELPSPGYIKKSINKFFDAKVMDYLTSKDLM